MISLLIVTALTTLPRSGAAAEPCRVDVTEWGPNHTLVQLELPDGRLLKLIGHNHGASRKKADLINAVNDAKSSNADYLRKVRSIVAVSAEAVRQSERELNYLRTDLGPNDGRVLALEANETGAQMRVGLTDWTDQAFAEQLTKRDLEAPELRRQVTLMMGGAEAFLAKNEPGLIKRHPLVGVDDGVVEDMPGIWREQTDAMASIAKVATPAQIKSLRDGAEELEMDYYLLEDVPDAQLLAHGLAEFSAPLKPLVERWMRAKLREVRIMIQRDRHIAAEIMVQKHAVTLLIGYNHLRSLADKFTTACRLLRTPGSRLASTATASAGAR